MPLHEFRLTASDGLRLQAREDSPETSLSGAIVLGQALGVPIAYYDPLAAWLAKQGFSVLRVAYRGTEGSPTGGGPPRLLDWGGLDLEAALQYQAVQHPVLPRWFIGHSISGQMLGLAPSAEGLTGMVLAASSVPDVQFYPWHQRPLLWGLWNLLLPLVAKEGRPFNAKQWKLGSGSLPGSVVLDWARFAGKSDYLFRPEWGIDTSRYAKLHGRGLALALADDAYAPLPAVEALASRYPGVNWETHCLRAADGGRKKIGHFGLFREKSGGPWWPGIASWLRGETYNGPR